MLDPAALEDKIRRIYETVREGVSPGRADEPDWVVKADLKGKSVTKSNLDGFKDCVPCYHLVIDQQFQPKTPGATSAGTIVADPTILYLPYNADIPTYGPFIESAIFDKVEVIRLYEANGVKQASVGFTMESARLSRAPIVFGTECVALALSYNKFSFTRFGFDDEGKKLGAVETTAYDFVTCKAGG